MSMNRVNVLLRHLQPEAMPAVPSPVAAKKTPLKVVITGAEPSVMFLALVPSPPFQRNKRTESGQLMRLFANRRCR